MGTAESIWNCYLSVDLPRTSRMELTLSSLREYQDVKIVIMRVKAITYGITVCIADGSTKIARIYLYTVWDTRSTGIRCLSTAHAGTRTAGNSQSFMDRIERPIVKRQAHRKQKQEGPTIELLPEKNIKLSLSACSEVDLQSSSCAKNRSDS